MQYTPSTTLPAYRPLLLMWSGVVVFALPTLIPLRYLPGLFYLILLAVGLLMLLTGIALSVSRSAFEALTRKGQVCLVMLLVWHAFMAVYNPTGGTPVDYLLSNIHYPAYLYPLALLLPAVSAVAVFTQVARALLWPAVLFLIFPLVTYFEAGELQQIFEVLVTGAGFLLLTYRYHDTRTLVLAAVVLVLSLLTFTLTARRNLMFTSALYLFLPAVTWFFTDGKRSPHARLLALTSAIALLLVLAVVFLLFARTVFSNISTHASENTREYVILFFGIDVLQHPLDTLLGRGIIGSYECPGVDEDAVDSARQCIENGFLQLVLKGGVVYLTLYLVTFVNAIRQGWHARNQLVKAAACICLVQLLDMIPFGLHLLNTKTWMVWLAVSLCYNRSLLLCSDDEIRQLWQQPVLSLPHWTSSPDAHPLAH